MPFISGKRLLGNEIASTIEDVSVAMLDSGSDPEDLEPLWFALHIGPRTRHDIRLELEAQQAGFQSKRQRRLLIEAFWLISASTGGREGCWLKVESNRGGRWVGEGAGRLAGGDCAV